MTLLCKCGNTCNDGSWDGTHRATCHRCGRQWEYRSGHDGHGWVVVVSSWEDRCGDYLRDMSECERERDEARAEVARLRHDPKADARAVIEEWRAKAERAWSDAGQAQERLELATALLRKCLPVLDPLRDCNIRSGIESITAGQPAPAKPMVDDAMVERAMEQWVRTDRNAVIGHRALMRAALVAALEGRA